MTKQSYRITIFILIFTFLIASCEQQVTDTPAIVYILKPTDTDDFVPVLPKNAEELVLFSIEENGHAHLFAYIPNEMPLTRLTNGDWDDITPAPSPDGKSIAFASNRFGYWDLYLMELSNGKLTRLTDTPQYEAAPSWSPDP